MRLQRRLHSVTNALRWNGLSNRRARSARGHLILEISDYANCHSHSILFRLANLFYGIAKERVLASGPSLLKITGFLLYAIYSRFSQAEPDAYSRNPVILETAGRWTST
jgi:hypothetical protein